MKKLMIVVSLCVAAMLLLYLTLSSLQVSAEPQTTTDPPLKDNFIVGAKMHYGFLWAHHTKMDYLVKGHVPAFEISLGKQTSGNLFWEQLYNYPAIGVSFLHFNLANPDELGNANGVFGYINFPLIRKKKFLWSYRFGTGIGVVDKPFDRITNYKNSAIGSQLNILITLLTETKWALSKNLSLSTGIGLTHFSNGAFKTPNLGINLPTVNIGASWHPSTGSATLTTGSLRGKPHANFKRDTLPKIEKEIEYSVIAAFGIKEIDPVGGAKYAVYTLSGNITKTVSRKRKLGIWYRSKLPSGLLPLVWR
ncbi:MAG TPA: acyloxyacyl hydrolase [bacterium]|nr:acyloxyacyl hydrolase [bacterium]